ncbi:MAG: hypothetical protein ACI4QW_06425 [Clostridia bacterium]
MMDSAVIVGILSFAATLLGTFGGIVTSSKLTTYRIEQLEKRVSEHNNLKVRAAELERDIAVLQNREKVSEHRINDLEGEVRHG